MQYLHWMLPWYTSRKRRKNVVYINFVNFSPSENWQHIWSSQLWWRNWKCVCYFVLFFLVFFPVHVKSVNFPLSLFKRRKRHPLIYYKVEAAATAAAIVFLVQSRVILILQQKNLNHSFFSSQRKRRRSGFKMNFPFTIIRHFLSEDALEFQPLLLPNLTEEEEEEEGRFFFLLSLTDTRKKGTFVWIFSANVTCSYNQPASYRVEPYKLYKLF